MEMKMFHYMGQSLDDCKYRKSESGYDIFECILGCMHCYIVCECDTVIALFSNYADLDVFIKARRVVK